MDNQESPKKVKKFWPRILLHLFIMGCIGLLIIFVLIYWLDAWTHHNEHIMVPRVTGMSYPDACEALKDTEFKVVLQDSIYDAKAFPGQVIDQNPKDSTFVKGGRTIFLTINAFYPRTVAVPNLRDISLRQALTTLEGLGIKDVTVKEVPSEYNNLVISVSYNGKHLVPGTRLPLTAKLVIEVGKNAQEPELLPDSASASLDNAEITLSDGPLIESDPTSATASGSSGSEPPVSAPPVQSDPDYFD